MDLRTKDDYLDAGMELLAEGGVGAITIARMCTKLRVTKGSFYHHFIGVEDFRSQLLEHWASERKEQVRAAATAVSDPAERLLVLLDFGVTLHHEAEAAIRAWAHSDPVALQVREQVDASRERTIAQAYREVGVPTEQADFFGRLAVIVLIGAQHRAESTDRDALRDVFARMHAIAMATAQRG